MALPEPGSRFGPYILERRLGRGGMGAVYLARHGQTGAVHALKVLTAAALGGRDPASRERSLARFRREVETLARIERHEGVAGVHTCGVDGGLPWCALEYVEGESLSSLVETRGRVPAAEAARIAAMIARAVDHVHHHGVLHRDLKPENVVIDARTGRPRVIDFGLAFDRSAERLTETGQMVGTPAFMAPEQISGSGSGSSTDGRAESPSSKLSRATDVYGIGGILYHLLTARPPFESRELVSLLAQVVRDVPSPPRSIEPSVPGPVEAICLRALAKRPEDRYASAAAIADELERWGRGEEIDTRRPGRRHPAAGRAAFVSALVAVAGAGIAAAFVGLRPPPLDAKRLARLERRLERGDALDARDRADAAALPGSEVMATDPALVRRARLVALLAADDGDEADVGRRLAELVRPDHARLDDALLRRAEKALDRQGRFAALALLLHGRSPHAVASVDVAADLARAIVASDFSIAPPADDLAFEALADARALDAPERGALRIWRARASLADGDAERAIDELASARLDHGVSISATELPETFLTDATALYRRRIEAGDDDGAARLFDTVSVLRIDGLPPPDLIDVAALQSYAIEEADDDGAVRVAAFVELLGLWLREPIQGFFARTISHGTARAIGEQQRTRPVSRRNPAILAFAAILHTPDDPSGRDGEWRDRLLEAAAETGVDGVWWHLAVASLHLTRYDHAAALEAAEAAWDRDRRLPAARRRPVIPQRIGEHLLRRRDRRPEHVRRAARVALEGVRLQLAALDHLEPFLEASGGTPWQQDRAAQLLRTLRDALLAVLSLPADEPCCREAGGDDDLEELIAAGIELAGDERARELLGMFEFAVDAWVFDGIRGLHDVRHGRHLEALPRLTTAIDGERERRVLAFDNETHRRRLLAELLDERAEIQRILGDAAAAGADREEAAELRRGR